MKTICGNGGHYSINSVLTHEGMSVLREYFPDGKADTMNLVLFSTSGVHGSYTTIEDAEKGEDGEADAVTFVIVQPRLVAMTYGNCEPKTPDDFSFLKKLRESSWKAAQEIGK